MLEPRHRSSPDPDQLPFAVLAVSLEGQVLQANQALADWVGRPLADVQGAHIDGLLAPGGRVLNHTYVMPLLQLHGHVQEVALALQVSDGPAAEVQAHASLDTRETPPRIELALVPMRERRRIEGELQRVQRAADSVPMVLFEYQVSPDGQGRFPYLSAGARPLLGHAPERVRRDDAALLQAVHPEDRPALPDSRLCAGRAGLIWQVRYRYQRVPLGPWAWHLLHATPGRLPDGSVV